MNIVVCIKAVPANIQMPVPRPDGSGVVGEGDSFMNESDDYALEQALLIKRSVGGKVTALTLGTIKSQDALHVCVAKGADEALRVDADEFDPNIVSLLLASAIRTLKCDLILTGVESADGMGSQVAVSVASHLGMPYVYAVNKVDLDSADSPLRVTRELGGGRHQMLEVSKPVLLCVQSGSVPLTYAPVVKLIHARRRGIPTISPIDLQISDDDLAARRKTKLRAINTVEKSSSTQWLTGTPAELAAEIMNRISKAR